MQAYTMSMGESRLFAVSSDKNANCDRNPGNTHLGGKRAGPPTEAKGQSVSNGGRQLRGQFSRLTGCNFDASVVQQGRGQRNKCTASTQATDTNAATPAQSSPAHLCGHVVCCGYEVAQCSRSFIIRETPKVGRCQSHEQQKRTSNTRFVGGCRIAAQFTAHLGIA